MYSRRCQPFGAELRLRRPSGRRLHNRCIAGLTLGGGTGHLTRKYGLIIDNLLGVDIVLADGSFVTADADDHPDLFWAVRGGGGNFGIVTSFLYRACPLRDIVGGPMFWDLSDAREVLEWHAEFMPTASEIFMVSSRS